MAFKQRSGRIINVSSIAAEHVNVGQANYAASKGAINSLTRVLAVELGRRNVLVNAVAPGFIETDMSQAVRNMAGEDNLKKLIPVRRLGKPEDIAAVVVFLAGPAAAYITGQVITVDGGLSLGAGVRLKPELERGTMTHDEIFAKVRTTLVDALNVDDDEVTPTARLKGDLNAESIDFLDIVFRLERQFDLKIPREELFPESIFSGRPEVRHRRQGERRRAGRTPDPHALRRPDRVPQGSAHGEDRRPLHGRSDRPLPGIQASRKK